MTGVVNTSLPIVVDRVPISFSTFTTSRKCPNCLTITSTLGPLSIQKVLDQVPVVDFHLYICDNHSGWSNNQVVALRGYLLLEPQLVCFHA